MPRLVLTFVPLAWLVAVASALGQGYVTIEVVGLPPGSALEIELSAANLDETASVGSTETDGTLSVVLDFANLGKPPSEVDEPTRLYVYYACGAETILFSDTLQGDSDCDATGVFIISPNTTRIRVDLGKGTVTPNGGGMTTRKFGGRFNVGGGLQNVENRTAELLLMREGFAGTGAIDTNQWSINFFAEYFFLRWAGGGYGYQGAGATTLSATFLFDRDPRIAVKVDGFFDPNVHNFYGTAQLPLGRVRPFFHIGGAYFDAESGSTQRATFEEEELDVRVSRQSNSGWGPYLSVGADIFMNEWLGVRVDYTFEKLRDVKNREGEGAIDEALAKLGLNAVLSF